MDYKYNTLSDKNLRVILQQFKTLRYEAQLELMDVLQDRNITDDTTVLLQQTLDNKLAHLHELGFLSEMGYVATTENETVIITRKFWPQVAELAGMILGIILVFIGVFGLVTLYYVFTGDESVGLQTLLINVFLAYLGFKGFQMLAGLPRFINNAGFKFSFSKNNVRLLKRTNFKRETFTGTPDDVSIIETENSLALVFKDIVVLKANPKSYVQRATINTVFKYIKSNTLPAPLKNIEYAS